VTDTATTMPTEIEPVDDFRLRLRSWLKDNMPTADDSEGRGMRGTDDDEAELEDVARTRELQRKLFDGGFAGIVIPTEYGGAGLTPAHQDVLNEEIVGYQYPSRNQVPTFVPCAAVILEFGSHEQKLRHIPPILRGEEIWMQFLSEPSGGSDVAGAQTTAVRDGDEWILNGSKIWTTGAWWSDWGLCLARTNPEVEKHRGLSVFMLRIHQPGIEVHRIEMLNGSKEFCQEFITDVRIPDDDRIGNVDDGWTVGIRWMYYERSIGTSPFVIRPTPSQDPGAGARRTRSTNVGLPDRQGGNVDMLGLARRTGRLDDTRGRELVGEAHALGVAARELGRRVPAAITRRKINEQAVALGRLMSGEVAVRSASISFELTGPQAVAWTDDEEMLGQRGIGYLIRQTGCIGGGTTEMARNVISERVLGMPRERTPDRELPFRDVPKGPPSR
jgi:alkylation response protein AidB-like acyl-CoA dehydrogenase